MKFAYLTLLDIARSQLPNAENALLSCCHTTEITEEMIAYVVYYERPARALEYATQRPGRKKRIALEGWVNFVHHVALTMCLRQLVIFSAQANLTLSTSY